MSIIQLVIRSSINQFFILFSCVALPDETNQVCENGKIIKFLFLYFKLAASK